jgi:hypothetical protein
VADCKGGRLQRWQIAKMADCKGGRLQRWQIAKVAYPKGGRSQQRQIAAVPDLGSSDTVKNVAFTKFNIYEVRVLNIWNTMEVLAMLQLLGILRYGKKGCIYIV